MSLLRRSRLSAVQLGMTLEALLSHLGPPNKRHGSGTEVLEYALEDGSRAEIVYANPRLIKIEIYRLDGKRIRWVPS